MKNDAGFKRRVVTLAIIAVLILAILIARLAQFQLSGTDYSFQNSSSDSSISTQIKASKHNTVIFH